MNFSFLASENNKNNYPECINEKLVRVFDGLLGDYKKAHDLCEKYGRKYRRTFYGFSEKIKDICAEIGYEIVWESSYPYPTLNKLSENKELFSGEYIICMRYHVFLLKDGVIRDIRQPGGKNKISGFWKLTKK